MNIKKLKRIKDSSEYYNLLLRYFSSPVDKDYELTEEEIKVFMDKDLFDQFTIDLAGRIILSGEEDFEEKYPEDYAFDIIFNIENALSNDKKEQMKQIRNCFAHSLTEKNDDNTILFDNGKIRGTVGVSQLFFVGLLYTHVEEVYKAMQSFLGIKESFKDATFGGPSTLLPITDATQYLVKRVLDGWDSEESVKNERDLNKLLRNSKTVLIRSEDPGVSFAKAAAFSMLIRTIDYKIMNVNELRTWTRQKIKGAGDIHIQTLNAYKNLINGYINYIGSDTFYNLDLRTQKDIIQNLVMIEDNNKEGKSINLSSILLSVEKLRDDVQNGKKALCFARDSKDPLSWLTHRYTNPIRYEFILQSYMYNRLVYLKELLNTNQIDESVLDYSMVQTDDIKVCMKQPKAAITKRKTELESLIESCKNRIQELKINKEKEEEKRKKLDNPKNPKRDELLEKANVKISKKQEQIDSEQALLSNYLAEKAYIEKNGKMPIKPITLFRVLRNSTTHGFKIEGRASAYNSHNLENLIVCFEDKDPKTTVRISVKRLIRLINDIEHVVIKNVDKISEQDEKKEILENAIKQTKKRVSFSSIIEVIKKKTLPYFRESER